MQQMRGRELGKKGLAKNESTKSNYKEICPHLGIAENRFAGEVEMKTKRKERLYLYTYSKAKLSKQRKRSAKAIGFHCTAGNTEI